MTIQQLKRQIGFTLVELIITITILTILGTIGFVSISSQSEKSRDSVRITNLGIIEKLLNIYQVNSGVYPTPENSFTITSSGIVSWNQGLLGNTIATTIGGSNDLGRDPENPNRFITYSTNSTRSKFQLMTFLDNNSVMVDNLVNTAYAKNHENQFPKVSGSPVGILLVGTGSNKNQPVNELQNPASFTGVDLVNTTEIYIGYLGQNRTFTGTGLNLRFMSPATSCRRLLELDPKLQGKDGNYTIYPGGNEIIAQCDMTSDNFYGYTMYKINNGTVVRRSADVDSCRQLGMQLYTPFSKENFNKMRAFYPGFYPQVVSLVGKAGGNFTGYAMNSSSGPMVTNNWSTPLNSSWFLSSVAQSEPNGDYSTNCYLAINGINDNGFIFNDQSCNAFGANYICTSIDETPTGMIFSTPTEYVDTSLPATYQSCKQILTSHPSVSGKNGKYKITTVTGAQINVFCDMTSDGGGYTVYLVENGLTTRNRSNPDSCQAIGLQLLIPRSPDHIQTIMNTEYGYYLAGGIVGVYGDAAGNYGSQAMVSTNPGVTTNWHAIDGGSWFMNDSPVWEPNGDYTPGDWLTIFGGGSRLNFNDTIGGNPKSSYLCGGMDK